VLQSESKCLFIIRRKVRLSWSLVCTESSLLLVWIVCNSSFSCSRDIIGAQKFKMGHVIPTTPLLRAIYRRLLGLDIAYVCTKFDHSSFSRSIDIVGVHQHLNGLHDLTTPLSGMICHPWASSCYDQPAYQIWRLSPPTMKMWKGYKSLKPKSSLRWF